MNISSTPFIRNDYWPDYNDIDILNKRIDEAENETSLVNSRLTNDIENVSNNLNSYKNEMADTVITNNIIVNNLNANYAIGKYANFANTNTDNAYIENLTVNKPVFDITLNTPHVENITSIGGNFYDANLFNVAVENITGSINDSTITNSTLVNAMLDGNGVLGNVEINNAVINTANVAELFVNTSIKPVTSSAVLGYDSEGRVIPIHAAFEVGFPENANYLYTDQHGTAFKGIAETEVNASDNLITSYAVYNALANVNNSFNAVNNGFNNVNNSFNNVNNFVNNGFNNVANELNDAYNTINSLQDKIRILSLADANEYWSGAPVNYKNVTRIKFSLSDKAGTQISGKRYPVNIVFNNTSNTLEFYSDGFELDDYNFTNVPESLLQIFNSDISYLFDNCRQLNYLANKGNSEFDFNFCEPTGNFITNMSHTFEWCTSFNQPVQIPDSVTDMSGTFVDCFNFNQNIQIPNSVTNIIGIFEGCNNFDQNIQIPDSVTRMPYVFYRCNVLNQNIQIPDSVTDMYETFRACKKLNQNILVPDSVTNIGWTFANCDNLNQNIRLSNSAVDMSGTFAGCYKFDQNIQIPDSVTGMRSTFLECSRFNQNILLPNSATEITSCFRGCNNLSQNILIPNSVTRMGWAFENCNNLNQPNMYIFSQNITAMTNAFQGCHINNIHIPTSVPKSTSNFMYNCLVNGNTSITFPAANIFNDLPVDISIYKEQFTELSVDLEHEYKMTINSETYDSSWSVTNGGTLQNGFFIYKDGNSIEDLGYIKFSAGSQIAEGDAYGRTTKIYRIISPDMLTQIFGDVSGNKQILPTGTLVTTDNGKIYRKLEPGEWS